MERRLATIDTHAGARSFIDATLPRTISSDDIVEEFALALTAGDPVGWLLSRLAGEADTPGTAPGWWIGSNGRPGYQPFPATEQLGALACAAIGCAIAARWNGLAALLPVSVPAPFHIAGLPDTDLGAELARCAAGLGVGLAGSDAGVVFRARAARRMGGPAGESLRALLPAPNTAPALGGDALSSFIVHGEPERDGIDVRGDRCQSIGVEIGVAGRAVDLATTAGYERFAARVPSFLDDAWSRLDGTGIAIGWPPERPQTAERLALAWHAWLGALPGVELVDVRIVFGSNQRRLATLADMRTRAESYRLRRAGLGEDGLE